jgi:antitoxin CptB
MALSPLERLKMLRLACRRGNAETEALLLAYWQDLHHRVQTGALSQPALDKTLTQFEQLLQTNDQDLMQWCLRPDTAPEDWQDLVEKVRTVYLSEH